MESTIKISGSSSETDCSTPPALSQTAPADLRWLRPALRPQLQLPHRLLAGHIQHLVFPAQAPARFAASALTYPRRRAAHQRQRALHAAAAQYPVQLSHAVRKRLPLCINLLSRKLPTEWNPLFPFPLRTVRPGLPAGFPLHHRDQAPQADSVPPIHCGSHCPAAAQSKKDRLFFCSMPPSFFISVVSVQHADQHL